MVAVDPVASRWLSVKEIAPLLGVSEKTVRRLLAAGEVGHYIVGHQIRIDRADLARYVARTHIPAKA